MTDPLTKETNPFFPNPTGGRNADDMGLPPTSAFHPSKDQSLDKAACDDWTKIPIHCAECSVQFLRKVRYQKYCDEHRHLGGAVIRPQEAVSSNERFSGAKPGSMQWHLDSAVDCLRAIADMGKKVGSETAANWLQQHGFPREEDGYVPGRGFTPDETPATQLVAECEPFLKEDETPAQCIARNRADTDAVLTLLVKEKRRTEAGTFQARVLEWMRSCFSRQDALHPAQRSFRFLEEALELGQAVGTSREDAQRLVEYVYARPTGQSSQEGGGVMVTLAGLLGSLGFDLTECAEGELRRCIDNTDKIRAKDLAKPERSPLPGSSEKASAPPESYAKFCHQHGFYPADLKCPDCNPVSEKANAEHTK